MTISLSAWPTLAKALARAMRYPCHNTHCQESFITNHFKRNPKTIIGLEKYLKNKWIVKLYCETLLSNSGHKLLTED